MTLFKKWSTQAYEVKTQEEYNAFWDLYLPKETQFYESILSDPSSIISGSIKDLAQKWEVDPITVIGFIDGINSSLHSPIKLDDLEESSHISFDVDFERLYFNMHEAKADWLISLVQWDDILTPEQKEQIKKDYKKSKTIIKASKPGRNDPCPCGSGKKYKKCCAIKESVS